MVILEPYPGRILLYLTEYGTSSQVRLVLSCPQLPFAE